MPKKNLFLFFVLTFAVIVGWSFLENRLGLKRPKQAVTPPQQATAVVSWEKLPAQSQNAIAIARLVADRLAGIEGTDHLVRGLTDVMNFYRWQPTSIAKKEPPKPKVPPRKAETVQLGNDSFNIKTTLTTRGAGVQHLILPHFEEANGLGLPEKASLSLIPSNPLNPSYVLYSYPIPTEENPEHPSTELGEPVWTLKSVTNGEDAPVHSAVFTAQVPGEPILLTKTYRLARDAYHIEMELKMERTDAGTKPVSFRYQWAGPHGLPIEGKWYTPVYRNAIIGWGNERGFERSLQDSRTISIKGEGDRIDPPGGKALRYAAIANQYFASAIVVDDHQDKDVGQNFLQWARPTLEEHSHPQHQEFLNDITVRVVSRNIDLEPGKPIVHRFLLYNGPAKVTQLGTLQGNQVPDELVARYSNDLHLRTLTDYGGWGWWSSVLIACTSVMHWLLNIILWVLNGIHFPWSYGIAIILLTVVVRSAMFPLSRRQTLATVQMQEKMAKLKQDLAPELRKIEEKYKDDPWTKRQKEHELYTKNGVNPAAMLNTCWVMLLQFPIFIGLYYALQESIHFRLKPFLWVRSLAAPDMLIYWGNHIPIISADSNLGSMGYLGPFFNLLPVIWVVLMYFQQKLLTPPAADEQQRMQQKMMSFTLILFFFFFYKVPAGLCLYYIGSMLWTLAERKLLPKSKLATASGPAMSATSTKTPTNKKKVNRMPQPRANGNGKFHKVSEWWAEVLKQAQKK